MIENLREVMVEDLNENMKRGDDYLIGDRCNSAQKVNYS
jgi:hypothetical protein